MALGSGSLVSNFLWLLREEAGPCATANPLRLWPASFLVPGRAHAPHPTHFGVRCCESRWGCTPPLPCSPTRSAFPTPDHQSLFQPSLASPSPPAFPSYTLQHQLPRCLNQPSWLRALAQSKQLRASQVGTGPFATFSPVTSSAFVHLHHPRTRLAIQLTTGTPRARASPARR